MGAPPSPLSYDRLRELLEAEKTFPWSADGPDIHCYDGEGLIAEVVGREQADLIVAAVNTLRPLLDENERLRTESAAWRDGIKAVFEQGGLNTLARGLKSGGWPMVNGEMVNWSDWLIQAVERAALRALSGTDTGEKVGG